jgi:MerR family transcriptional regulator, heat shock protein HspR
VSRPSGAAPSSASRVHRPVTVPDDIAPLFTVSQAAEMLDMQPAFIRRLDTEGVVCPARSPGGQRRYSRVELNHIAALAALMSEGMTLVGAQRIIELENEVAELRRQLAAEMSTRARARRPEPDSPSAPHAVVDAQLAHEQAPIELATSLSTPGVVAEP